MPIRCPICQIRTIAFVISATALLCGRVAGQDAITLAESFKPGHSYKVDVKVTLAGRLTVQKEKGKPPQVVTIAGESRVVYDERVLAPDEGDSHKTVRAYREIEFQRKIDSLSQDASIRPSVRRLVVTKAGPKKAPFSPDGPLTWGEIDVVRTDLFIPATVPGLLTAGAVKPGQSWNASDESVAEITDMEKVEEGGIMIECVGVTTVNNRKVARLRISGTVRGVNEDGPNRQKLDGTAYFDLDARVLIYLSLKATKELLDGNGHANGSIEGRFTLTSTPYALIPADLSDASLTGLKLQRSPENTLLLYDNPALGVRFLYPRGWRVGAVQGKQVTLDHARAGGGILITIDAAAKVPTPDAYAKEVSTYLSKEKAEVTTFEQPSRVRGEPATLDRFRIDATFGKDKVRLDYFVLWQPEGGATIAVNLPAAAAPDLADDVDRISRSLSITKKIE